MNTTDYPGGFPLAPVDAKGQALAVGDSVKILRIPDWLLKCIDRDSIPSIKSCEGQVLVICDVDDYGYFWVERVDEGAGGDDADQPFNMDPKNLLKV